MGKPWRLGVVAIVLSPWVAAYRPRIDPATNRVVATIHMGPPLRDHCLGTVARRDGTVRATSSSARLALMRIDPTSNRLAASSELPILFAEMLPA